MTHSQLLVLPQFRLHALHKYPFVQIIRPHHFQFVLANVAVLISTVDRWNGHDVLLVVLLTVLFNPFLLHDGCVPRLWAFSPFSSDRDGYGKLKTVSEHRWSASQNATYFCVRSANWDRRLCTHKGRKILDFGLSGRFGWFSYLSHQHWGGSNHCFCWWVACS